MYHADPIVPDIVDHLAVVYVLVAAGRNQLDHLVNLVIIQHTHLGVMDAMQIAQLHAQQIVHLHVAVYVAAVVVVALLDALKHVPEHVLIHVLMGAQGLVKLHVQVHAHLAVALVQMVAVVVVHHVQAVVYKDVRILA